MLKRPDIFRQCEGTTNLRNLKLPGLWYESVLAENDYTFVHVTYMEVTWIVHSTREGSERPKWGSGSLNFPIGAWLRNEICGRLSNQKKWATWPTSTILCSRDYTNWTPRNGGRRGCRGYGGTDIRDSGRVAYTTHRDWARGKPAVIFLNDANNPATRDLFLPCRCPLPLSQMTFQSRIQRWVHSSLYLASN